MVSCVKPVILITQKRIQLVLEIPPSTYILIKGIWMEELPPICPRNSSWEFFPLRLFWSPWPVSTVGTLWKQPSFSWLGHWWEGNSREPVLYTEPDIWVCLEILASYILSFIVVQVWPLQLNLVYNLWCSLRKAQCPKIFLFTGNYCFPSSLWHIA